MLVLWISNIFHYSVICLFLLWYLLILSWSNLQFSFMVSAFFLFFIKELPFYLKEKKIFSIFIKLLVFDFHMQVYNSSGVNFYIWCVLRIEFHFSMWFFNCLSCIQEKMSLTHKCIPMGAEECMFLGSLFYVSCLVCLVFHQYPHSLHYNRFIVGLDI